MLSPFLCGDGESINQSDTNLLHTINTTGLPLLRSLYLLKIMYCQAESFQKLCLTSKIERKERLTDWYEMLLVCIKDKQKAKNIYSYTNQRKGADIGIRFGNSTSTETGTISGMRPLFLTTRAVVTLPTLFLGVVVIQWSGSWLTQSTSESSHKTKIFSMGQLAESVVSRLRANWKAAFIDDI